MQSHDFLIFVSVTLKMSKTHMCSDGAPHIRLLRFRNEKRADFQFLSAERCLIRLPLLHWILKSFRRSRRLVVVL